jgi:hypothetical protein
MSEKQLSPLSKATIYEAFQAAAEIADEIERQQEIDHGAANTGGAEATAAAIRAAAEKYR